MLWRLSEKVSLRLKNGELAGSTITLKLKTADFRQRTRSQSIHAPTQLAAKIFAVCREMLAKEIDGTSFRLMGTGVSALKPGSQADDSDMLDRRSAHAERAIDDLRKKFGSAAVIRGIAYDGPEKAVTTQVLTNVIARANGSRLRRPMINSATSNPSLVSAALWIASRSLSSGAHSRGPLARNDGR